MSSQNFFKSLPYMVAVLLITSCIKTPVTKTPDQPKLDEISFELKNLSQALLTCTKAETDQGMTSMDERNSIKVTDTIATVNNEYADCDGNVTTKARGAERFLKAVVSINAPETLKDVVSSVEVSNARTCTTIQVGVFEGQIFPNDTNSADRAGNIKVKLSDQSFKLGNTLNVVEGKNLVKLIYFGKCLKRTLDSDKANSKNDCLEYETLANQSVVIDVEINRPETNETRLHKICK